MATQANLEHGRFSDSARVFIVRASSREAPDSFQVAANDNPADLVLVVSGLNSGDLRATWGENWRTASEEWRRWCERHAFLAFYSGVRTNLASTTTPASTTTRHPRQAKAANETGAPLASPTTPGSSDTRGPRQPLASKAQATNAQGAHAPAENVAPGGHRCERGDLDPDTPDPGDRKPRPAAHTTPATGPARTTAAAALVADTITGATAIGATGKVRFCNG